jgi:glycosyltransferase involved in cell wall biosynthesis
MKESRVCLITPGYPSQKNLYNCGFVHTRVKEYLRRGLKVDVFVFAKNIPREKYIFEDVEVNIVNLISLRKIIKAYDFLFIHFISPPIIALLNEIDITNKKIQVWFHGAEVLSALRRLFEFNFGLPKLARYTASNFRARFFLRRFLGKHKTEKIRYIFPSLWLKDMAERDLNFYFHNFAIIPNPVDVGFFEFKEKHQEDRFNFLSVRSYSSYKYATDISQRIIFALNKNKRFQKYRDAIKFEIYGDGKFFERHTSKLKDFKNVSIHRKFLTHEELRKVFSENGIFLCPTRQDAQGVTMCEAMSCGLVPISSYNSAIPEFVTDRVSGFLARTFDDYLDYIFFLLENPQKYVEISKKAREEILKKCDLDMIVSKELDFLMLD